jgi:hypothetical protein
MSRKREEARRNTKSREIESENGPNTSGLPGKKMQKSGQYNRYSQKRES